jgi:hypothetical protein
LLRLEEVSGRSPLHDVKDYRQAALPPANFSSWQEQRARFFVLPRFALLEDVLSYRAPRCLRTNALKQAGGRSRTNKVGGARRDRTDDLLLAKQALSQLSYGPVGRVGSGPTETRSQKSEINVRFLASDFWLLIAGVTRLIMVGLGRLELPTSRLSGVRSNHLSYRPDFALFALLPEERETETAESRSSFKDPVRFLNRSVV